MYRHQLRSRNKFIKKNMIILALLVSCDGEGSDDPRYAHHQLHHSLPGDLQNGEGKRVAMVPAMLITSFTTPSQDILKMADCESF